MKVELITIDNINLNYAPLTSDVDVERSLSSYKNVLKNYYLKFDFLHLKEHVVSNCSQIKKKSSTLMKKF